MKHLTLTAIVMILLTTCKDEDQVSPIIDPFVGSWQLDTAELDIDLKMSFDITKEDDHLLFSNIKIEYPGITGPVNYHIETYDQFAVNDGFEDIQINGSWSISPCDNMFCDRWIIINMNRCIVHLKTRDVMDVYRMDINMINQEPVILDRRAFFKTLVDNS